MVEKYENIYKWPCTFRFIEYAGDRNCLHAFCFSSSIPSLMLHCGLKEKKVTIYLHNLLTVINNIY